MFTKPKEYTVAGTVINETGLRVKGEGSELALIVLSAMKEGHDCRPVSGLGVDIVLNILRPENSHLDFTPEQLRAIEPDLYYSIMFGCGLMSEGFNTRADAERGMLLNLLGLEAEQASSDDSEAEDNDDDEIEAFINDLLNTLGLTAEIQDKVRDEVDAATEYEKLSPEARALVDEMRATTAEMTGLPLAQVIRAEQHFINTGDYISADDPMFVNSND